MHIFLSFIRAHAMMGVSRNQDQPEDLGDMAENSCYLLGAGFSKAISKSMPVMTDLAEMVMPRLDMTIEELAPFGDDLEQWLSFLANPQPWLAESQNLKNRAMFLEASQAIYTSIRSAEETALEVACPRWLRGLVDELSDVGASVLTFNYDLLLERAAVTAGRAKSFSELYVAPVLDRRRPGTGSFFSVGESDRSTFELYKLHGSINWLTQASSSLGTSSGLFTDEDRGSWKSRGGRADSPGTRYRDLSRMVVPPVSTKDSFYSNDALNAQWKMAANRLGECVELVICGYSFPATDYSTRALIRTRLSDAARVVVIDPADRVSEVVSELLGSTGREIQRFQSIESYVDALGIHVVEWGTVRNDDGTFRASIELDGAHIQPTELPSLSAEWSPPSPSPFEEVELYVKGRWPAAGQWRMTSDRLGESGGIGVFRV